MLPQEPMDLHLFWTACPNTCLDVCTQAPQLLAKLIFYLGQTFEGGISGRPQTEAHGAYAYLALACLCILGPPHEMIPK